MELDLKVIVKCTNCKKVNPLNTDGLFTADEKYLYLVYPQDTDVIKEALQEKIANGLQLVTIFFPDGCHKCSLDELVEIEVDYNYMSTECTL